jgi:hypothetical protein
MDITVYQNGTLREGAQIAITARLFIPGWSLHPTLCGMRERRSFSSAKIAIGFKNGVAICLALIDHSGMYMAFCRKSERRNGYTSKCVHALGHQPLGWAGEGVYGTMAFWEANKVYASPRRRR